MVRVRQSGGQDERRLASSPQIPQKPASNSFTLLARLCIFRYFAALETLPLPESVRNVAFGFIQRKYSTKCCSVAHGGVLVNCSGRCRLRNPWRNSGGLGRAVWLHKV